MKHILVIYHSQEKGNTRHLAELVAEGCRTVDGIDVTVLNVNEERVSIDLAEEADGYALGSPDYFSYVAGNLKQFFDDILLESWHGRKTIHKPAVGFITHGGGGAARKSLEDLMKACSLHAVAPVFSCRDAPKTDAEREGALDLGKALARAVADA